jgi:membrane protease YdiL (CAAX protease family)
MNSGLGILIFLLATAIYGYVMPRHVNKRYYTLGNLIFAGATLAFASWRGVSWQDLGLNFHLATLAFAVLVLGSALAISSLIIWHRKHSLGLKDYLELTVRVPFGTALAEELIFRGALMGLLAQNYSWTTSLILSSVVFGFWHLLPGSSEVWAHQNLAYKNVPSWVAKLSSSAITVAITTVGGLLFGWLRIISAGIILPWAAHASINIVGWVISRKVIFSGQARSY